MIKINLIPPEFALAQSRQNQRIIIVMGVAVVGVLLAGAYLMERRKVAALNSSIAETQAELKKQQAVVDQIAQIDEKNKRLKNKRDVIVSLNKSRLVYPVFFEDFLPLVPADVWITDLKWDKAAGMAMDYHMTSKALSNYALATWLTNLQQSTHFSNVKIDRINYENGVAGQVLNFQLSISYHHQGPMPLTEG